MFVQVENKGDKELTAIIKPAFESDVKDFFKIQVGQIFEIKEWQSRNLAFHKKFFALLKCSIHHLSENVSCRYRDKDYLRSVLMILIGYSDVLYVPGKGFCEIPKSISFAKCSQKKFEEVYSMSIDALLKHFLSDISQADFEKDILNFL